MLLSVLFFPAIFEQLTGGSQHWLDDSGWIVAVQNVSGTLEQLRQLNLCLTRRKTFTHEKREQVGMDLVRSTEANRNHTGMHVIINTHPCNSLYKYSYYMHVYILYGPCLLFSN